MKWWRQIFSSMARDMGIDLGTANTLVYVRGKGIQVREPSVIALDGASGRVLAVGDEAKRMVGRTPASIHAVRPLKDGVIADFEHTEKMLRYFMERVHKRKALVHPMVVVGIPSGVTEVERRAVKDAAKKAGARDAFLIEEPMAAAIGAGMPVGEPVGCMIADIGGGTSEIAVISLGGVVASQSIRIAGDEIDQAIVTHVRREYNLLIGERTAEEAKIRIGCAVPLEDDLEMEVRGRDLVSGLPRSAFLRSSEIMVAISEPLQAIVDAVKLTLERTPPELAADIMERGIMLAGGGALLRGLDKLISKETLMPVVIAPDPLAAVALGTGRALEEVERNPAIRKVLFDSGRP